jgi:mono/diheme cytochrome c family protein
LRLKQLDRGLALVSWLVAAVLALMLLAGPKVIAEDKGQAAPAGKSPYAPGGGGGGTAAPGGKALFASNCGSCHTLSAAGTSGAIGPKLDGLAVDAVTVKAAMQAGPGSMPSFSLSAGDTDAIAKFVEASSR